MVVDWFKGFKVVLAIIIWKTCEDFCNIVGTRLLMLPWTSQVVDFSLMKFHNVWKDSFALLLNLSCTFGCC
jgi:hypothetical protein